MPNLTKASRGLFKRQPDVNLHCRKSRSLLCSHRTTLRALTFFGCEIPNAGMHDVRLGPHLVLHGGAM